MKWLSRWCATGSLLVVILGAPAFEVAHDNWPTAGLRGAFTQEAVLSGGAAVEIVKTLERGAATTQAVRPRYNEMLYSLFGVVSQSVVVGKDNWLFPAGQVLGRTIPDREGMAEICGELQQLVRWFNANGTEVVFELIPRKQTFYPEMLPDNFSPPFVPAFSKFLTAMQSAGLNAVDLTDALGPRDGLFYKSNDSHWNDEGARRATAVLADKVRSLYPEGELPGTPIEATLRVEAPADFTGNLVDMLGFRKTGFLRERFTIERRRIRAVDPETNRRITVSRKPEPIVLLGTSFSGGYDTAAMLTSMLGRVVEDRSKAGIGTGYRMVDLFRELLLQERGFPDVLIWEFPEDFLTRNLYYFLEPVRSVTAIMRDFPYKSRPLPVEARSMKGLRVSSEDETGISGAAFKGNAEITYTLSEEIPGDGSAVLAFPLHVTGKASARVRWDATGEAGGEYRYGLRASKRTHLVLVRVMTRSRMPVRRIHIGLPSGFGHFHLGAPELWTP